MKGGNALNKTKLRLFIISFASIVITIIAQGTLAYYTALDRATNIVTSGDIELEIHETINGTDPFPEGGVYVMPGAVVGKQVNIENTGNNPFYLRVKVVYSVNSVELSADNCFKLHINPEHWQLVDGWYYYTDVVEPSEITPNVFSHVEIVGNEVDNSYIGHTLSLTVKAQAVQSKNNEVVGSNTYTALGWPEE